MIREITFLVVLVSFSSCAQDKQEIMYQIHSQSMDLGDCGYVNKDGDTLVPIGKYYACFSDSLPYAIVGSYDGKAGFLAINSHDDEIFRVFPFDNGPDYIEDGTMRIIEDGKIGYATEAGEIIIPPSYAAAWPFENGKAQVSINGTKEQDGEHWRWIDTDWFFIDKEGNRVEE